MNEEFPWYSNTDKQLVRVVKPMQTKGDWLLCANMEGQEWFIPVMDLVLVENLEGSIILKN